MPTFVVAWLSTRFGLFGPISLLGFCYHDTVRGQIPNGIYRSCKVDVMVLRRGGLGIRLVVLR
jgi:hypothetical protein